MAHRDEYRQWPFLNQEEFELAGAFFDQKYVRAKLGPTRRSFKVRTRRVATTGDFYIEILRLLQPPDDADELSQALKMLGGSGGLGNEEEARENADMELDTAEEDADQETLSVVHMGDADALPHYSQMPTLWFTLHDLPMGEPVFDLDSVYRYLVPSTYQNKLRAAGIAGGISAAPHPITHVPAFFIHPCQTKEAMETFDCSVENYLMLWIGLVGGCVGLWVPPEMAVTETHN